MNFRKFFSVPEHSGLSDGVLLLIRVVAGLAFVIHGWGKIQDPLNWMGVGAPIPGFFQALAAIAEFGGGMGWILGLLTPLACLGVASTMSVAIFMHAVEWGHPFVSTGGGPSYELALVYLCVSFLLLGLGPGRLSVDRAVFGPRSAPKEKRNTV